MKVVHELEPFVEKDSKILILGSIPSVKSREEGFYYMHPQNRFWKVLSLVYQEVLPQTIQDKKAFLKRHQIALYDVLSSCEIEGSKDETIRNEKPNKLRPLLQKSEIARVYTTGRKAYQFYQKYSEKELDLKAIPLPSTSPLNAKMTLQSLQQAYQVLLKSELSTLVEPLLAWYQKEKRHLPWRNTNDPYSIWISEIMLQQTRVEAVKRYYERFLKELPTIASLAMVEEDRLLKLWEGLGYYSRARNLQKAAQILVEKYEGMFPKDYEAVRSLPGVGNYTAGAILSIAFSMPYPAVDGNVFRVLSRFLNVDEDITKPLTRLKMENRIKEVLTPFNAKALNQALMELGALICLPKEKAKCSLCPLQALCKAHQENTVSILPIKPKKKEVPILQKTILLLVFDDTYALLKRPSKGLLAGLYQFPELEGMLSRKEVLIKVREQGLQPLYIEEMPLQKHVFTHQIWEMKGYSIRVTEKNDSYLWVSKEELSSYSIPTAYSYYSPLERKN